MRYMAFPAFGADAPRLGIERFDVGEIAGAHDDRGHRPVSRQRADRGVRPA